MHASEVVYLFNDDVIVALRGRNKLKQNSTREQLDECFLFLLLLCPSDGKKTPTERNVWVKVVFAAAEEKQFIYFQAIY